MSIDEDLINCLDRMELDKLFTQLSPNTKIGTDKVIQNVSIRGIPETRLKRPLSDAREQMKMAAYRCESVKEMFALYFQCSMYASMTHVESSESGMPTRLPFPCELFDQRISLNGWTNEFAMTEDSSSKGDLCIENSLQY